MSSIDEFLLSLRLEGKSPQTIALYGYYLRKSERWAKDNDVSWDNLDSHVLRRWASLLWECGWQPSTIRLAMAAARRFLGWAAGEGLCEPGLAKVLKLPRVPLSPQRTLSRDEIEKLGASCDTSQPWGRRDLAILFLLLDTGMRAAELCGLKLAYLDLERRSAVILIKGRQWSYCVFGEYVQSCLTSWLKDREGIVKPGIETVFISIGGLTPGQPLTTRGLRSIFERLGKKSGVIASPHACRRSFATFALEYGASDRMVQAMGRWSSMKEVERYSQALQVERGREYLPVDRLMEVG